MQKKIYIDTSFLLDIIKFKINLKKELDRILNFEYKLVTFDLILKELENKPNENLAKLYLKNIKILKTPKNKKTLDDVFINLNKGAIVATNDKELKKTLKSKHIKTLTIRQKKYLTI